MKAFHLHKILDATDNLIQLLNNFIDAKFMDALRKDDLLISDDYQVLLEELTSSESKPAKQELSA
ncbi:hypothetical protein [Pediococcus pentosaceus]|uniref:hypothetical protein n=1 Tax=Pediococcus pentosaceus TaxID=1255 RepID=UPI001E436C9D|nr:hypothetical protein [Pediococcus pentosaceus]